MIDSKPIKCTNLTLDEVIGEIKDKIREIKPSDKIIRIKLEDINSNIYRGLDFNEIKELTKKAIHCEIKADLIKNTNSSLSDSSKIDTLVYEFEFFLNNQDIENKELLLKLGIDYIAKIEAKNEGK